MRIAALLVVTWCSLAFAEGTGRIVGRAATVDGKPLAGATFLAIAADGRQATAVSGANGEAVIDPVPPGHYTLVTVFGDEKAQTQVDVAAGATEARGFVFARNAGEVIRIEERVGPSRRAAPELQTRVGRLPYSDEAIDTNIYGVVWLLLDLDVEGRVTQATVLKAPKGAGLEEIALRTARKLRYSPARNDAGEPIPTTIVVVLQWPPFWAAAAGYGVWAHCAGEGPMNLDVASNHVVGYVDCEPPPGFERSRIQLGRSYRGSPPGDMGTRFSARNTDPLRDELRRVMHNDF